MFDIKTSRASCQGSKQISLIMKKRRNQLGWHFIAQSARYHLRGWVWGDWLKADKAIRDKLGIRDKLVKQIIWDDLDLLSQESNR